MKTARAPRDRFLFDEVGNDLVIRRRTGSNGGAGFILLLLTGWTVICVMFVMKMAVAPTTELVLFSIPFLSGWPLGFVIFLGAAFGFERLQVGFDGLEHRTLFDRRLVPLEEIKGIADWRKTVTEGDLTRTEHFLMFETAGWPLRFGRGLDEDERRWLVDRLLGHLRALKPGRSIEHHTEASEKPGDWIEPLRPGRPVPAPPSDRQIRLRAQDWDGAEFVRRGNFSPAGIGATTVLALLVNGFVGIFVGQLFEHFQWAELLFLIPFGAIGLAFIALWVLSLIAPFVGDRWVIGPRDTSTRFTCLGIGRTRHYDVSKIARIELRRDAPGPGKEIEVDTPYSLSFVEGDGQELMTLSGMSEGEARWVGGVACDTLKGILPRG